MISAYPFTKIDDFPTLTVVVHFEREGVTVASLCRGGPFQKMARAKKLSFFSC